VVSVIALKASISVKNIVPALALPETPKVVKAAVAAAIDSR
jgi:hypothetical protein